MDAGGSEGENKEAFNGNSLDVLKSTHSWRVLEEHEGIEEYGFENEKRVRFVEAIVKFVFNHSIFQPLRSSP